MSRNVLTTPVLLLTFNRPDLTREVLGAIREARPQDLFVASDGPRPHVRADDAKVTATRALLDEMIDWPCTVHRRLADTNQGCRVGVSSAISWFFEHVDEGIILEDDCVPHPHFFGYCTQLLERYRHDERVMNIAGDNSARLVPSDPTASYCFTRQPLIWGWATWKRAWDHYDSELAGWRKMRGDEAAQRAMWPDRVERRWQRRSLDRLLFRQKPDSWDLQWSFTVAAQQALSVTPTVNLIRNIGFGPAATHTRALANPRANVAVHPILPLTHPAGIRRDVAIEQQIFDRCHRRAPIRAFGRRVYSRLG